jgi:iron complex outermembrane recepter protein
MLSRLPVHRSAVLLCASGLAFVVATPALADPVPDSMGGEIMVTARKTREKAQDVPISITSVSTEKLASVGATKLLDISSLVPGFIAFSQTGAPGSVSLDIRGISTADASSITVATTVDDVPVNSSSANAYAGYAGLDLLPALVGGIEVLKGPQGTLYGASSLGGLMKYVTTEPSLTRTDAVVGAGVSTTAHSDQMGSDLSIKGETPIVTDRLAIGFAAEQVYTPGYLNNATTGQKDQNDSIQRGGRLTVLFTPSSTFKLKLNAIVQDSDAHGLGAIQIDPVTDAPTQGYYNADFPLPNGSHQATTVLTANAQVDLGLARLTSVTGYSRLESSYVLDLSNKSYSIALGVHADDEYSFTTRKFSQEFRLDSSGTGPLTWNLGVFYTSESSYYVETSTAYDAVTGAYSTDLNPYYYSDTASSYKELAGFGGVGWKITPKFDINVSGRFSANWQTAQADTYGVLADYNFNSPNYKSNDSKFTYAVNARYFLRGDVMAYARLATGYRPGGPNLLSNVPATFRPDTTTNYEIGVKSQLFDHKLLFDLTGFLINWNDMHVFERQGSLATYTGNAGTARSQGVELATAYHLTHGLKLGLNGSYTDAHLTTAYAELLAPAGFSLPNQPKWSGALTADWTHSLGHGTVLTAGANWLYVGPRWSDFLGSSPAGIRLKGYDTLALNAGVDLGTWAIGAYVRNLADEHAYVTRRNAGAVILQPRTAGLSVSRTF